MNTKTERLLTVAAITRLQQLAINSLLTKGAFKVPVHLGIGHELLAAAVCDWLPDDKLFLSHRNIHFNLASGAPIMDVIAELSLDPNGLNRGMSGSMNLASVQTGVILSSSILGGQTGISVGFAYARAIASQSREGLVWCVLGDGAIEEGSFYESVVLAKALRIPVIFLVEDNEWSLATQIHERRNEISLNKFGEALGVSVVESDSTEPFERLMLLLSEARHMATRDCGPVIFHHRLDTFGSYVVPSGTGFRTVNYHSGPARSLTLEEFLANDPQGSTDTVADYIRSPGFLSENERLLQELQVVIDEVL